MDPIARIFSAKTTVLALANVKTYRTFAPRLLQLALPAADVAKLVDALVSEARACNVCGSSSLLVRTNPHWCYAGGVFCCGKVSSTEI